MTVGHDFVETTLEAIQGVLTMLSRSIDSLPYAALRKVLLLLTGRTQNLRR